MKSYRPIRHPGSGNLEGGGFFFARGTTRVEGNRRPPSLGDGHSLFNILGAAGGLPPHYRAEGSLHG